MRKLFRQEAIVAQREKLLGEVSIARPVPTWVFTTLALAFAASEGLEWLIFTVTRRPFRERVVVSAVPSVVLDSAVFLALAPFPFSWALFLAQIASKLVAVLVFIPLSRPRVTV